MSPALQLLHDFMGWIAAPFLAAFGWLVKCAYSDMKERAAFKIKNEQELNNKRELRIEAIEQDMELQKSGLKDFQLFVSQNYATKEQFKELSSKLDDHNAATTVRLDQIYNVLVKNK